MPLRSRSAWVVALSLVSIAACDEKKDTAPRAETHADAGPALAPGVDKNLAEAVAAVAGQATQSPAGPPETGIFGPGAADKELPPSAPPKLVLGGKGSGPTVTFGAARPDAKLTVHSEVAVQTGPRSALPTVDLTFVAEAPKAKDTPAEVAAKVTQAKPAASQPGQLPPGVDAEIAKAKGSVVGLSVAQGGGARVTRVEPARGLDPSLGQVVQSASDGLVLPYLPYPGEPVGVGAFWMVTSRERFAGLDVVAYRMIKLEGIEGDRATLSLETKRYVAGGQVGFPGVPPHQVVEFGGGTQGRVAVQVSDPAKLTGEITDVVLATLSADGPVPGQPPGMPSPPGGQRLSMHVEIRSRIDTSR